MDPAFCKTPGNLLSPGNMVCHLDGFDQPFLNPRIYTIGNAAERRGRVRVSSQLKKLHDRFSSRRKHPLNQVWTNTMFGNLANDRLLVLGKDGVRKIHAKSS